MNLNNEIEKQVNLDLSPMEIEDANENEKGIDLNKLPIDIRNYILRFLDAKNLSFFGRTNKANFKLVINLLKAWGSDLLNIKLTADSSSLFLYTPDELYVCGDNSSGNLGVGHSEKKISIFQSVGNLTGKIKEVFSYRDTTYAVTAHGLFGCGNNQFGQLGLGNTSNRNTFIKIPHIEGRIIQVVQGNSHTFVLTDKGLFGCGSNKDGELGFAQVENLTTFKKINVPGKVKKVATFNCSSFVLTDERLFASGGNSKGQLGLGDKDRRLVFTSVENTPADIQDVIAGSDCAFLISNEGLYACGDNRYGNLGLIPHYSPLTFTKITLVKEKITKALTRDAMTLILAEKTLYCFGAGFFHSSYKKDLVRKISRSYHEVHRAVPLESNYERIYAGTYHFLISTKNSLAACGNNLLGALGLENQDVVTEFRDFKFMFPGNIQQVIAEGLYTMIYTDKGIYFCGVNNYRLSGLNDVIDKVTKLDLPKSIQQRFDNYALFQSFMEKAEWLKSINSNMNDHKRMRKP